MPFLVNIFLQTQSKRILIASLHRSKNQYVLQYEESYLKRKNAIPLGPELALSRKAIISKQFFPSLADRLPSRQNPAYADYCQQWNISPEETDPLILLSTIGQRGPSAFIFRQASDNIFGQEALINFRKELGLSVRELAAFLDTNPTTITKTEMGNLQSSHLLALCELLANVPAALDYQLHKRGQYLHDDKIALVKEWLKLSTT